MHLNKINIRAFLDEELGTEDQVRFQRHLYSCETCQALIADKAAQASRIHHKLTLQRENPGVLIYVKTDLRARLYP